MKKILISTCLLGCNTKYNGKNNFCEKLIKFINSHPEIHFIPICPEQLGGLETPRLPAEIKIGDGRDVLVGQSFLLNSAQENVTENFIRGAEESIKIAELFSVKYAILKERSPSCGKNLIVKEKERVKGCGVTTALFLGKGIKVFSEEEIDEFEKDFFNS